MDDLISVIVPIYNMEPYLRQCLDSILTQTYRNLEVILVDDGSTDGSGAICDAYGKRDTRVTVIHKKNGGLSSARNAGLDNARGDWISFVDSDDWIAPIMCRKMLEAAIRDKADAVVCGVTYVYRNTEKMIPVSEKDVVIEGNGQIARIHLSSDRLRTNTWNKLYHRELVTGIRFPEGRNYEDILPVTEALLRAERISLLCDNALYFYRQRTGSIIHEGALKTDIDRWHAHKARYDLYAEAYPDCRGALIRECAKAAVLAARHFKPVEDKAFVRDIQEMNHFLKEHKDEISGSILQRIGAACVRIGSPWSLAAVRMMFNIRDRLRKCTGKSPEMFS